MLTHRQDYQEVDMPHDFLTGAKSVAYSYKLTTSEGSLKMTEWTSWVPMDPDSTTEKIKLPVIVITDNSFYNGTRRVIYHRITKTNGKEKGMGTKDDPVVVAAEVDGYGVQSFTRPYPKKNGGK